MSQTQDGAVCCDFSVIFLYTLNKIPFKQKNPRCKSTGGFPNDSIQLEFVIGQSAVVGTVGAAGGNDIHDFELNQFNNGSLELLHYK